LAAAVLLIDAANVIGSRPTGWWRDRPGAARAFVDQVRAAVEAGRITQPVTVVLEGKARQGAPSGGTDDVTVVLADGSGDDKIIEVIGQAPDQKVTLVTADRALRRRAEALGADVAGPGWLLDLLG
jgi:predicted ribonuclease YlaK